MEATTYAAETVLYLGLRRSALEWQAELDAAAALGLSVHVASDADLTHTGLPPERLGSFDRMAPLEDQAERAAPGMSPAAVVCWGDKYVGLTAHLAGKLGVRGIGTAAAAVTTDKVAQRRALDSYGLNPRWRSGHTVADLRASVSALGFSRPLVFKAARCSGGRGIAPVTSDSDLDEVFKLTADNYDGTSAFVVEELVGGTEHSISGLVDGGETVRILGVSDKRLSEALAPSWATMVPSALNATDAANLKRAAETAVRAVGLRTGGFHVDLRLTDEGPKVLEVGGRLGGDLINSHLIPLSTQDAVRPYEALLTLLTTGELPEAGPEATRGAAMVLLPNSGRPVSEVIEAVIDNPLVTLAVDWPGTDTVAALVVTEDPDHLPEAVTAVGRMVP